MVVVRFSVFTEKVRNGTKRQTIRPANTYPKLRVGGKIHCYSIKKVVGARRPVLDELLYVGEVIEIKPVTWQEIKDDEDVAQRDGFTNAQAMRTWLRHNIQNSRMILR